MRNVMCLLENPTVSYGESNTHICMDNLLHYTLENELCRNGNICEELESKLFVDIDRLFSRLYEITYEGGNSDNL